MVDTTHNIVMKLIEDSGSTKTDWILIDGSNNIVTTFSTKGLNPNIVSDEQIVFELNNEIQLKEYSGSPLKLFFYGAGCSGANNLHRMQKALQSFFINALIEVRSDIEAAVYATCDDQPAIVAILGTGSNSCLFTGEEIKGNDFSLGYILGDEGSGNYFGKKLLRDYFYGDLPSDLQIKFLEQFEISRDELIQRVYKEPLPNEFIASFLPFFSENIEHTYCDNTISLGVEEFLRIYIKRFKEHSKLPIHFVGSAAYYFDHQLYEMCAKHNLRVGKILKSPISELAEYHIKKYKS